MRHDRCTAYISQKRAAKFDGTDCSTEQLGFFLTRVLGRERLCRQGSKASSSPPNINARSRNGGAEPRPLCSSSAAMGCLVWMRKTIRMATKPHKKEGRKGNPYSSLALVSVWCPCRRFGRDRGGPRVIYSGTPVCLRTVGALSRASVTWRPPTWSESLWPS